MAKTGIFNRLITNPTYLCMVGYITTIVVHTINTIYIIIAYSGDIQQDPDIDYFRKYHLRMLTIWAMIAQVLYSALGLSHDLLSLSNEGKDTSLLKTLRSIRDPLFSCVVFPLSWVVAIVFWIFFTYEPATVLPVVLINTFPPICNHIFHTFIIPVTLWEVAFRPRTPPKSQLLNMVVLFGYGVLYMIALFLTYHESGRFPYPIINTTYGTPYFYLLVLASFILNYKMYKIQWYLSEFLWRNRQTNIRKVNYTK